MTPWTERVLGYALIVASAVGLVANVVALLFVPSWTQEANRTITSSLSVFDQTMTTTVQALEVLEGSLDDLGATLGAVEETGAGVATSLSDTVPLIDSIAAVTGEELPAAIASTQQSLAAAQVGASSIDGFLATLAFFGGNSYDPEVTLAASLGQISTTLDPLAESLVEIQGAVQVAGDNLQLVEGDVESLNRSVSDLGQNLEDAQLVNEQYREVVTTQQSVVKELLAKVPTWITWGGRAFAAVLLWLAIAQCGMLTQGIELVARSRRRQIEYDVIDELTGTETASPTD